MLRMIRYSFTVDSASVDLNCTVPKGRKVNRTRLLWWLGPWCDQQRIPQHIEHVDLTVTTSTNPFRFRLYQGSVVRGAVLVLPGLHPDGIDDSRLDRFCRVLADSGVLVGIPELPTMRRSIMDPSVLIDTEIAAQVFLSQLENRGFNSFGMFCISASSIAGLYLCAHPELSIHVHRLHLFGGFFDWMESLRFAMTGKIPQSDPLEILEVDPLSLPVVYMNLMATFPAFVIEYVKIPLQLRDPFLKGLHSYVGQCWEKPDVSHPKDTLIIANRIVQDLLEACTGSDLDHRHVESVFKRACALEQGGDAVVHDFLNSVNKSETGMKTVDWLDPKPLIQSIQMPLDISHGREDFVVPYPQAHQLVSLSRVRTEVFVTGLYHHTGVVSMRRLLSQILGLPKELWTSLRLVNALARLGTSSAQEHKNNRT
jgi:pimeloyl-ACP methyl ester carboxylesterase